MRFESEVGSQRSAWIDLAFWECLAFDGTGGRIMSVRMRLYCGSERRCSARSWPMKPAAPVINILGIFDESVIEAITPEKFYINEVKTIEKSRRKHSEVREKLDLERCKFPEKRRSSHLSAFVVRYICARIQGRSTSKIELTQGDIPTQRMNFAPNNRIWEKTNLLIELTKIDILKVLQ